MAVELLSATHLLVYDDDGALLMIRRFDTGYEDGNFLGHRRPHRGR